jgi:hypothetical protein
LAAKWVEHCETTHLKCRVIKDSPIWRPTRLIHIGRRDSSSNPRLCLSDDIPFNVRYITLSHRWGQSVIFKLVESDLDTFRRALPLERLTNVSRDAMEFARHLDVEYIWIDFLCIIQDSHSDWVRESAMMGEIYKNSWFNISATGFPDGNFSLYVQRNPATLQPRKFNLSFCDGDDRMPPQVWNGNYYCMEEFWQADITEAHANTRGWILQERLLAPRILHFSSRQIMWECKELEACEVFLDGIPTLMNSGFKSAGLLEGPSSIHGVKLQVRQREAESDAKRKLHGHIEASVITGVEGIVVREDRSKDDRENAGDSHEEGGKEKFDNSEKIYFVLLAKWREITGAYNSKRLTRYEDKFVAIAALASEMQKLTNEEYIAGLWKRNFLHQLAWHVSYETTDMGRISRPPFYQAPSWSWACLNASISDLAVMGAPPLASIEDYDITLADKSLFGRVTDGYIRIRGRLSQATFVASDRELRKHWGQEHRPLRLRTASSDGQAIIKPWIYPDTFQATPYGKEGYPSYPIHHALGSREFWLLPLCLHQNACVGLILKHTGIKGQYQRIGTFAQLEEYEDTDKDVVQHLDFRKELQTLLKHSPLLHADEYKEPGDNGHVVITII